MDLPCTPFATHCCRCNSMMRSGQPGASALAARARVCHFYSLVLAVTCFGVAVEAQSTDGSSQAAAAAGQNGTTPAYIIAAAVCAGVLGLALLTTLAIYCWLRNRHVSEGPGQAYAAEPASGETSQRRHSQRTSAAGAPDKAAAAAQAAALLRSRSTLGTAAVPLSVTKAAHKHSPDYGTSGPAAGGVVVIPVASSPCLIPPIRSRGSVDLTATQARARRASAHLTGTQATEAAAFAASMAAAAAAAEAAGTPEGMRRNGSATAGEAASGRGSFVEGSADSCGATGPTAPRRPRPVAGAVVASGTGGSTGSRGQRRSVDNYMDRLQPPLPVQQQAPAPHQQQQHKQG